MMLVEFEFQIFYLTTKNFISNTNNWFKNLEFSQKIKYWKICNTNPGDVTWFRLGHSWAVLGPHLLDLAISWFDAPYRLDIGY